MLLPLLSALLLAPQAVRPEVAAARARHAARVIGELGERGFTAEDSGEFWDGYSSQGTFRDPASGIGGVWFGFTLRLVPKFPGPVDREAVAARLSPEERERLADPKLGFSLDLSGLAAMDAGNVGDTNGAAAWTGALARAGALAAVLGKPEPLVRGEGTAPYRLYPREASFARGFTLPPEFRTTSVTFGDMALFERQFRWPEYTGGVGGIGIGGPTIVCGEGDYCCVFLHLGDPFAKDGPAFGGAVRSFELECRMAPAAVGEGALGYARGQMPGWEVAWEEVQGLTARRRVDLRKGMTVGEIGRLVPALVREAAPVCLRYRAAWGRE